VTAAVAGAFANTVARDEAWGRSAGNLAGGDLYGLYDLYDLYDLYQV